MLVRNIISCGVLTVILAGCGDTGEIKDAVNARLRDPDSSQFNEVVVSKGGDRACIEYNAKNGFGGYGDPSIAELRKFESKWVVTEMNGSSVDCGEEGFAAVDAGEKAEIAAKSQALSRLKKLGKFSSPEEESDAERGVGVCGKLLWEIGYNAKRLAEQKIRGANNSKFHEIELAKNLAKIDAGDCSS